MYEEVPPKENEDTVISHVINAKCLRAFMKFEIVGIQGKVGGQEYYVFKEVWKQGGLYIINCEIHDNIAVEPFNHAFLYNADYTGPDKICHGSIVDNQKHTHLLGIEKSDVSTVAKARYICNGLFHGVARFTHCYKVTKKRGEASSCLEQPPSKKRKHNNKKKNKKIP